MNQLKWITLWMALLLLAADAAHYHRDASDTNASLPAKIDPHAWTELDIVPMPKEIRLTDNDLVLDPDKVALVIGADACEQSRIGADWINRRLQAVGGNSVLPVISGGELPADRTAIIIGTVDDNPLIAQAVADKTVNVGEKNPGERGYEIRRPVDGQKIYLAGADNIGALYACVTFGELLEMRDGQAVWRAAEVRDWPDLIRMHLGMRFAGSTGDPEICAYARDIVRTAKPTEAQRAAYLDAIQKQYDWLLRRKVTLLFYEELLLRGRVFQHTPNLDIIREGIEYGKARGIGAQVHAEKPYVGLAKRYPEAAASDMGLKSAGPHPSYKAWIRCWSMDDLRRATARELAEHIRAVGLTDVNFHDTDTGWFDNPAQWNERCAACRERWGDDYAAATVNKHMIYVEEIKKLNPDIRLHFCLYPYNIGILDQAGAELEFIGRYGNTPEIRELAGAYRRRYTEFWRRMDQGFPRDNVTFAIREQRAPAVDAIRAIMPGRGLIIGFALLSHAWRPLFSEAASWSATFINNPRDCFGWVAYLDGPTGLTPLEGLAVREYSWNKKTPGARPFDRGIVEWGSVMGSAEQWRHAEAKGAIYEVILPRLARNIFGRAAAPRIAAAVSQNVDIQQIFDHQRRQFTWLKNSAKMQWQVDNAARGVQELDALWEQCAQTATHMGMSDYAFRRFVVLRENLHMGMWMGRIRTQNMLAHELALAGDLPAAEQAIAKGLEYAKLGAADRDKLLAARPADSVLGGRDASAWHGLWRQYTADRFTRHETKADFEPVIRNLERTRAGLKDIAAAGSTPKNILDTLAQNRLVYAHRAPSDFDFNNESSVMNAFDATQPVESFLVCGTTRLAQAHTRARLLFDDDNLYLYLTARLPGGVENNGKDSIELFIQPPELKGDYVHFFLSADGKLRQQYNAQQKLADGVPKWGKDDDWTLPGIEYRACGAGRHWEGWIKIPAADWGRPGRGAHWRVNLMRVCPLGSETEISSILPPASVNAHDVSAYPAIQWRQDPWPAPEIGIEAPDFSAVAMTLPDTVATVASFRLELESDRVLHDVSIEAEAYDAAGKLHRRQTLAQVERMMYRWTSPDTYVLEYESVSSRGGVLIKAVSAEGASERWVRFGGWAGSPSVGAIFASGRDERQGLQAACYFADRLLIDGREQLLFNNAAGTLEFWFKPIRDWIPAPSKGAVPTCAKTLVHYGPVVPSRPLAINNSPLTVRFAPAAGRLHVSMFGSRNYAGWQASALIGAWPADEWRHIAVVWDAAVEEKDRLRIYMDGKRVPAAPGYQNKSRLPEPPTAMLDTSSPYPVQIGSLNSGRNPMQGVLDELRITRSARYTQDFDAAPAQMREPDHDMALLLTCDGVLTGTGTAASGVRYEVIINPNTANLP